MGLDQNLLSCAKYLCTPLHAAVQNVIFMCYTKQNPTIEPRIVLLAHTRFC